MEERGIPGFVPPMTVERFELTHEVTLYIHEKDPDGNRDKQIASVKVDVPVDVANAIAYQVHRVLADACNPGLVLPFVPKEENE